MICSNPLHQDKKVAYYWRFQRSPTIEKLTIKRLTSLIIVSIFMNFNCFHEQTNGKSEQKWENEKYNNCFWTDQIVYVFPVVEGDELERRDKGPANVVEVSVPPVGIIPHRYALVRWRTFPKRPPRSITIKNTDWHPRCRSEISWSCPAVPFWARDFLVWGQAWARDFLVWGQVSARDFFSLVSGLGQRFLSLGSGLSQKFLSVGLGLEYLGQRFHTQILARGSFCQTWGLIWPHARKTLGWQLG